MRIFDLAAQIILASSLLLGSCASYAPEPLAGAPDLRSGVSGLVAPSDLFPLPERRTHRYGLNRPLGIDEIGLIAAVNNPDLKAARSRIGVAHAQAFAAGILPNPQASADYGFLLGGPGTMNSIVAGLSQDIVPLLTLSTRKASAQFNAASVELAVIWQEWQTIGRARLLFVDAISLQKQRRLVELFRQLLKNRYETTSAAMQRGDQTLPTVTNDLVALNAAETLLYDLEQAILKNKHDLNAVLGLIPEANLRLEKDIRLPAIDAAKLAPMVAELVARRPDLVALRAGYEAQEEKVRQAIIEQFPKLSVGSNHGQDTTGVRTQSIAITVSVPIFDRNQGGIAVQSATRQQLHEEYQARLDTAVGEAGRLMSELRLAEDQYRSAVESVRRLRDAVATAEPAFQAGNLDERTFVDLRSSLLGKEIATAKLEQIILEQRVGLQALVGSRLPNLKIDLPSLP
jgi:outer membrane protein TolC